MTESPQDRLYQAADRLSELARCRRPMLLPWQAREHLAMWVRERGDDYRSEARAASKWPPGYKMLLPPDFDAAVAFAELVLKTPQWDEIGDIIAALVRRTGTSVVEIADDDLKRADGEVVRIEYDEDGCARVEIVTEVPDAAE